MSLAHRAIVTIFCTVVLLAGCSNGQPSRYPYYTGIKNPRIIQHPQNSTTTATHSVNTDNENEPTGTAVNDQGYPLPNIVRQSGNDYRVQRGDTLYSIAWQYGYDVRDVARWNRIRPPYTIYPRQRIRIKPPILKKSKTAGTHSHQGARRKPVKPVTRPVKKTQKTSERQLKISWQWPTKGKIIGRYSARESGKKGLDIAGKKGQPVYSAAGGEIVYSGSGLRGYGKLVIIKHNDTFFSAYAHNHRLYVREQQQVKKGQHIADMGSSEAERAMLHFEVRRNGKPVDPLRYLPRR